MNRAQEVNYAAKRMETLQKISYAEQQLKKAKDYAAWVNYIPQLEKRIMELKNELVILDKNVGQPIDDDDYDLDYDDSDDPTPGSDNEYIDDSDYGVEPDFD